MSIYLYTRNELDAVMSDTPDFVEDIKEFWFGERKALFCSIEGSCSEEEQVGYDLLQTIVEGKKNIRQKESLVGEECYCLYSLSERDMSLIWNWKSFESVKEKTFVLVEINIPGMTDYLLFF